MPEVPGQGRPGSGRHPAAAQAPAVPQGPTPDADGSPPQGDQEVAQPRPGRPPQASSGRGLVMRRHLGARLEEAATASPTGAHAATGTRGWASRRGRGVGPCTIWGRAPAHADAPPSPAGPPGAVASEGSQRTGLAQLQPEPRLDLIGLILVSVAASVRLSEQPVPRGAQGTGVQVGEAALPVLRGEELREEKSGEGMAGPGGPCRSEVRGGFCGVNRGPEEPPGLAWPGSARRPQVPQGQDGAG